MKWFTLALVLAGLLMGGSGCKFNEAFKKKPYEDADRKAKEPDPDRDQGIQPADAGLNEFLVTLRQAVNGRDLDLLASLMSPQFGYQIEPPLEGDGVFVYWDQKGLWEELKLTVKEPFVPYAGFYVAPPAFADQSKDFHGYRAGVRKIRGKWRFMYFVNG